MSLTDDAATAPQLKYARDLGLKFPANITKTEISELLDRHLSKDIPSSSVDRRFAAWLGYDNYTQYVGKRELFERLHEWLIHPGREEDCASWFIFRVCRHLSYGKHDHPRATGPDCVAIREIAAEFVQDESAMRSLRRYRGDEFIRFGEYTGEDGNEHCGGSVRTNAYKKAVALINKKLRI